MYFKSSVCYKVLNLIILLNWLKVWNSVYEWSIGFIPVLKRVKARSVVLKFWKWLEQLDSITIHYVYLSAVYKITWVWSKQPYTIDGVIPAVVSDKKLKSWLYFDCRERISKHRIHNKVWSSLFKSVRAYRLCNIIGLYRQQPWSSVEAHNIIF